MIKRIIKRSDLIILHIRHSSTVQSPNSPGSGYRVSTSPSGVPLSKILSNAFPLSVKESIRDYFNRNKLEEIQDNLLKTLPYYPNPSKTHKSKIIKFKFRLNNIKEDNYINEFLIEPTKPSNKHIVFIHGYGAGLGFFIKNMNELTRLKPDWNIHAIDLPGYGCSTRFKFPHEIPYHDFETVEKLFTEPLKNWFLKNNLDENNTIVVSHSMGAYIAAVLGINESKSFWNTLILVSPGGIYQKNFKETLNKIPKWFVKLWNLNISPFSLVRYTGPLGSLFVSGWTSRRFSKNENLLSKIDQKMLHMYSYSIFNAKGSGEYMLNYLLAPGAIPRHPLIYRINKFKCNRSVWLYGSHDWMDYNGGLKSSRILVKNGFESEVKIVNNSGHHIYLDNFRDFNNLVLDEINLFEKKMNNL